MKAYIVETEKLKHNIEILKQQAGSAVIWGVVKGNGYGLGAGKLALLLKEQGIDHFAVTDLAEARALREAGLTENPILMLRATSDRQELEALLSLNVICTLGSLEDGQTLHDAASSLGRTAHAHVKLDTGMGRYGFLPEQTERAAELWKYDNIKIEGVFTHFYRAGSEKVTKKQFSDFRSAVDVLRSMGLEVGMVHCCNSLGFWYYPEMHLDAVRLGSALLGRVGYGPRANLRRIGYVQADVEALRVIPKGHNVGYGGDCRVRRDTRIAVIGVGYFHGFSVERGYDVFRIRDCLRSMGRYLKYLLKRRCLTVEVNGKTCKVLGHVGMVNLIADVTDISCALHDPVKLQINPLDLKGMEVIYR